MRCAYEYSHSVKECPREAVGDLPYCIFHLPEGGKDFEGAMLEDEDLEEAYLSEANLRGARLSGANLRWADLSDATLDNADLSWASLVGADLSGASAREADFTRADLRDADLSAAVLEGANLSLADLRGTNLIRANLRGVDLYGAILDETNVLGTDLRGARLYGASLKNVRNLENALIDVEAVEEREGDRLVGEGNLGEAIASYKKALSVYLVLKEAFRRGGLYDKASAYSVGEWRVRGKLQRVAHLSPDPEEVRDFVPLSSRTGKRWLIFIEGKLRWLANVLYRLTSNYGESPWRIFVSTVFIIALYSFLYWITGAVGSSSMVECLYFSVVTFTTVGYGDVTPLPGYRLLAGSEAFIGAFLMAFFVVVMSRKLIR
ncbi:pentapeptide repeat-containing protein [Thermococcus gammatolerans]|uniref:Voltage-gated potassium channel, putative n=1 Tax=Thermococcus gammatolerans (strain DSM 15229 / JCM 11827 / EJ3) TaxID=593117 RepID=C5A5G3_THEGJ|nr:pentapeptide repeat-containing protein [Thermococcus gammatolerans]ACS33475.1 Voltage-gated potassium channel, putative [Thermococcus gammatolerans EJ3]